MNKMTGRKQRRLRRRVNRMARKPNIYGEFLMPAARTRVAIWNMWRRSAEFRRIVEGKKRRKVDS